MCDVGAGVAHLTLMLASKGLNVLAVEPNDAMRNIGELQTKNLTNVTWKEGTGEATKQKSGYFDLVTFGSSFNVCDREQALMETARILKPDGWFACLWNHRRLEDSIQTDIERIIRDHIPNYDYGLRREDQRDVIDRSNLFNSVIHLSAPVTHQQSVEDCIHAWRSHATLERQAKTKFKAVVDAIEEHLMSLSLKNLNIPYLTNIWMAQLR